MTTGLDWSGTIEGKGGSWHICVRVTDINPKQEVGDQVQYLAYFYANEAACDNDSAPMAVRQGRMSHNSANNTIADIYVELLANAEALANGPDLTGATAATDV